MSNPENTQILGKQLAERMSRVMDVEDYEAPVLAHALAFLFAALLASMDGQTVLHEDMGLGLIGDNERLDLFREEVLEMVAAVRAKRLQEPDPNQPTSTRRVM